MGVNKVAGYSQRGWLGTPGWGGGPHLGAAHTWGLHPHLGHSHSCWWALERWEGR